MIGSYEQNCQCKPYCEYQNILMGTFQETTVTSSYKIDSAEDQAACSCHGVRASKDTKCTSLQICAKSMTLTGKEWVTGKQEGQICVNTAQKREPLKCSNIPSQGKQLPPPCYRTTVTFCYLDTTQRPHLRQLPQRCYMLFLRPQFLGLSSFCLKTNKQTQVAAKTNLGIMITLLCSQEELKRNFFHQGNKKCTGGFLRNSVGQS